MGEWVRGCVFCRVRFLVSFDFFGFVLSVFWEVRDGEAVKVKVEFSFYGAAIVNCKIDCGVW